MKILLFGKDGQLGWEFQRTLAPLGQIYAVGRNEQDLTDLKGLRELIRRIEPQIIVNASAYTAVDQAESNVDLAMTINAAAPEVMAEEAKTFNAVLMHFSTDYVFNGEKGSAYNEEDPTNPLNIYGQSKLTGEKAIVQTGAAHIILRTSWVYSMHGDGFVSKVLSWARKQETLRIVSDQYGSPTWSRMLAETTSAVLARSIPQPYEYLMEKSGVYHLGGSGAVSRYDFAQMILRLDPKADEQIVKHIEPALTSDFPTHARRPLFAPLDCSRFTRTFGVHMPFWEDALRLALGK